MSRSDIVIVGGGLIGATLAWELSRRGRSVTLLEKGEIGRAASWAAGGVLTPVHIAEYPGPLADLCRASQKMYPDFVAQISAESGVDVELHASGMLFLIQSDDDERDAAVLEAWRRSKRLKSERLTGREARRLEPVVAPDLRGALLLPEIAQVRNNRLTRAVAEAARRRGVRIQTGVDVKRLKDVSTGTVIVAAGAWSGRLAKIPVTPARGQMVLVSGPPGRVHRILLSRDQYVIPRRDGRLLIGSTVENAGFDARPTLEGVRFILGRAAEFAPGLAKFPIEAAWAGLRPRTPDRLPFIGPRRDGVVMATGHFRNGILLAPITAKLIGDWFDGKKPDLARFAPTRRLS